jgi:hypothetical protein
MLVSDHIKRMGYVYVIQQDADEESGGPVKIGWSGSVKGAMTRLGDLQVGNPHKLSFLLIIHGPREAEAQLHAALTEHRMSGEWFRPGESLWEVIDHHLQLGV